MSGNLLGPSLFHIQQHFYAIPQEHFVNLDHENIVSKVVNMLRKVQNRLGGESIRVGFYVCIGATVASKTWNFLPRYEAILVNSSPHNFISIEVKIREQVKF